MDLVTLLIACLIGIITGLVPGMHVNTLAALAIAAVEMTPELALALVAVGTVHTVVSILPATYLGAPGEDTAIATLPAHRMLQAGRAPEAIHLSVAASLLAMMAVVLLLLPVKWLLTEPTRLAGHLETWMPILLTATLVLLLAQERHRGIPGILGAVLVMALAGVLGILAWDWPTANPWNVAASPLLPLLTGLFAAPTLLQTARHDPCLPLQDPPRPPRRYHKDTFIGTAVAAATAVLPGLTAAVATAIARAGRRTDDPRPVLATLSAVNTAHLAFAMTMLWIVGTTRSGLADAVRPVLRIQAWHGPIPIDLHGVLFVALLAATIGAGATLALEPWVRRITRLPTSALHIGALGLIAATVILLTGPWGVALFVAATAVGQVPLRLGIRRVHLAACLIIPVLLYRLA